MTKKEIEGIKKEQHSKDILEFLKLLDRIKFWSDSKEVISATSPYSDSKQITIDIGSYEVKAVEDVLKLIRKELYKLNN